MMTTYLTHAPAHRWLSTGNLVARFATVLASALWSGVVFWYEAGFTQTFTALGQVMAENYWAMLMLAAAVYVAAQTVIGARPNIGTWLCNMLMFFLWVYTVLGFFLYWHQPPPGGFGSGVTLVVLALLNLLALPRRD